MKALTAIQKQKKISPMLLQKIAKKDRTAVADFIETYGRLIWSLARKFTVSIKDAEMAAQEIFIDVWQYAEKFAQSGFEERVAVTLIARRCLCKRVNELNKNI